MQDISILNSRMLEQIYYELYIKVRETLPPGQVVVRVSLPQDQWQWVHDTHADLSGHIVRGLEIFGREVLMRCSPSSQNRLSIVLSRNSDNRLAVTIECVDDRVQQLVLTDTFSSIGYFSIIRMDGRGSDWIPTARLPVVPTDEISSMPPERLDIAISRLLEGNSSDLLWADRDEHIVASHQVTYFSGERP